ncbi:unnamed protein product [Dibothriocephalus latus]|uniref:Uncharacterized protein n=1 Tax=Dibothriocephalus latus TaxID=60516 RepID=A0A3P7N5M6_DIBLA|nr:unnamed protein product [Dibothriocephalus latus]
MRGGKLLFSVAAQLTTIGPIKLCSATKKDCLEVSRVNETFNAFNHCAFQCDGWTTAANSKRHSIIVCNVNDVCVTGSYFTKPKAKDSFESLKACIVNCMPTDATDMETVKEDKVQDLNEGK